MPAAALANGIALVRDDHVVSSTLEVFNQLISNVLLDLVVINDGESRGCPICSKHFIELADLIAEVLDLFSVDRQRFAEYLRARLLTFRNHVVLCEARDGRIEVAPNVFEVLRTRRLRSRGRSAPRLRM